MNNTTNRQTNRAFSLIELLVVIAVIALLAAMIFPVTAIVNKQKIRNKARAELNQVSLFIDGYKDKLGFYPPGNATNYAMTPLFYELSGATRLQGGFETLDRASRISQGDLQNAFGVTGLANSMAAGGGDEGRVAQKFLMGTRPVPSATLTENADPVTAPKVLVTSVRWRQESNPIFPSNPSVSPIFYNPVNPTNNPSSYDLWVDVIIGSKTNRISNWSKEPIVLE